LRLQIHCNFFSNGKAAKARSKQERDKKNALLQEREKLRAKLAETKNNVKKVEMEIGHIKQDLRKEGKSNFFISHIFQETAAADISESIREAEQRKVLIDSFLIVMTEQMQTTKQYHTRLSSILENLSEIRRR
jgi:flagellar biosynthesis GTPase FlhF